MDSTSLVIAILIMFVISYLMKALPLVFCKGQIKNQFVSSFLYYVPFAVMTSIVLPEVFFSSTSSVISASIGLAVAVVLGLLNQNLLTVALSATAVVFIVERILGI